MDARKLNLIILLVFVLNGMSGQTHSIPNLVGKWQLKEGWFPEANLEFITTKLNKSNYAFRFEENGNIEYLGSLDGMDCVVGEFTMKDGHWSISNNFLTLELRGLSISDYWYWWIVEYKVKFEDRIMILEVNKIIKNKEISPSKTWEELINE